MDDFYQDQINGLKNIYGTNINIHGAFFITPKIYAEILERMDQAIRIFML